MDKKYIGAFMGEKRYLSNMFKCEFYQDSIKYNSTEEFYMLKKCLNPEYQRLVKIHSNNPHKLKSVSRRLLQADFKLVDDWNDIKTRVMFTALVLKFSQNQDLLEKLISTKDEILIEENNWGDTFWGVCDGKGQNHLGKLLMKVRDLYHKFDYVG